VLPQTTVIFILAAVRTWNLTSNINQDVSCYCISSVPQYVACLS
jgi:hypothetical protein